MAVEKLKLQCTKAITMISVVIVDDESLARETLKSMLAEMAPDIEVMAEGDGVATGVDAIQTNQPDAIFLDVQMDDGTGFDLLDHFPKPDFGVVFTTGYDKFALAAFENNALHYLIKPLHPHKLLEACNRLREKARQDQLAKRLDGAKEDIRENQLKNITLRSNEEINFLKLDDIIRLEASDNCTFFYPVNRKRIFITKTLREYEKMLPDHQFFRTHQSHILNRKHVLKVSKEDGWQVLMSDESLVPISRRKTADFLDWMEQ